MKEIISFYIGQAGVQLSNAIWELFATEHGISSDGFINENLNESYEGVDKLFYINSKNQAIPRCILIDMEPSVIDEIRSGPYRQFFGHMNLLNGIEDSSSIFARGYLTHGRIYINDILQHINHQLEITDSPQAIVFIHSLGGGTGSGLFSFILEELDNYNKTTKIDFSHHPSTGSQIVVEPYNSILSEHYTVDEANVNFMFDNEALFKIATKQLLISRPTYSSINKIIAQTLSLITSSSRYSDNSCTFSEILHNLVPFPRIHYPICSLSPMYSLSQSQHVVNTVNCITKDALSSKFQMLSCDPMEGKFLACCFMYRGNINSGEIHDAIRKLKYFENLKFVDWCPTGIKVTLCKKCPSYSTTSNIGPSDKLLSIIGNNSAVTDPLLYNTFRVQLLFQKRAFVHWYVGEGMEEEEFKESLENIACLIKDYEECSLPIDLLAELSAEDKDFNDISGTNKKFKEDPKSTPNPNPNDFVKSMNTEMMDQMTNQLNNENLNDSDLDEVSSLISKIQNSHNVFFKVNE